MQTEMNLSVFFHYCSSFSEKHTALLIVVQNEKNKKQTKTTSVCFSLTALVSLRNKLPSKVTKIPAVKLITQKIPLKTWASLKLIGRQARALNKTKTQGVSQL